jgi:anti-sigma B factor antagonist
MKITTRKEKRVTILELSGTMVIAELQEQVKKILALGDRNILINLKGIKEIDSSSAKGFANIKTSASNQGAVIKLLHVGDKVQQAFEIAKLGGVFEAFDDEIDAIVSFRN